MKLLRLRLENFRQFRGTQEIYFATGKRKNITLIWGANGAGKTTLLNAFTWTLYGIFTKDFEKSDLIYNLDQWTDLEEGHHMTVAIELEFENANQTYTIRRQSKFRKGFDEQAQIEEEAKATLTYVDDTGRSQRSGNPDDHIRQILPERLHSFFFFNGERIEHLVQASAYEEIEDAIKTVLGLKVFERAIKHLPTTAKSFEDVLRDHGTDEQRELATKLNDIDRQLEEIDNDLTESLRNAGIWQDEIEGIDKKLRGTEEARAKQRRRDELNLEEARSSAEIDTIGEKLDLIIRERGFLAAGLPLFQSTKSQFADKREKKELPTPIKRDFIEDLLEDGVCICGASLNEGTPGHEHITAWRERAGLADVEQRWSVLHAHADLFTTQRNELRESLRNLLDDREESVGRLKHTREQLSELSRELKDTTRDDIAALESARVTAQQKKDDEMRNQGRLETGLKRLAALKSDLETQLKRAQSGVAKAELARRRLSVAQDALQTLKRIYEIRIEKTRSELDQKIKEEYSKISFKTNVPQISQNFQLQLFSSITGEPVAKSTGENQILSLSFVGALAAIARARYEQTVESSESAVVGARGGIYPIVMDAAFGSLDLNYRRDVSLGLPKLAEQVVVMVSQSGGEGVYEYLAERIGKSYVISYVTPKGDAEAEMLVIGDHQYPYVEPSADGSEYATFTEVK